MGTEILLMPSSLNAPAVMVTHDDTEMGSIYLEYRPDSVPTKPNHLITFTGGDTKKWQLGKAEKQGKGVNDKQIFYSTLCRAIVSVYKKKDFNIIIETHQAYYPFKIFALDSKNVIHSFDVGKTYTKTDLSDTVAIAVCHIDLATFNVKTMSLSQFVKPSGTSQFSMAL